MKRKLKKLLLMALFAVTCLAPMQANAWDGVYNHEINGKRLYDIYFWNDGPILIVYYEGDTIYYVWIPNIAATNDQCRRWTVGG